MPPAEHSKRWHNGCPKAAVGSQIMRREILDGTEAAPGYARAVRKAGHVHVSGTTSMNSDGIVIGADMYAQTIETYRKIAAVLEQAEAEFADIVRVVVYVTDIAGKDGFVRAHAEVFETVRPAATLVEVSALVDPKMLIEIEVYAIVENEE